MDRRETDSDFHHGERISPSIVIVIISFIVIYSIYVLFIPYYYHELLTKATIADSLSNLGVDPEFYAWFVTLRDIHISIAFIGGAFFLLWKQSDNTQAHFSSLVLLLIGSILPAVTVASATELLELISDSLYFLCAVSVIILMFISPDGQFYPKYTKLLASLWLVVVFLVYLVSFVVPIFGWPENAAMPLAIFWLGNGLLIQTFRYFKRYDTVKKQQTKWLILGFSSVFLGLIGMNIVQAYLGATLNSDVLDIHFNLFEVSIFGVPPALVLVASMVISYTRFRLWDLGIVLKRGMRIAFTFTIFSIICSIALSLFNVILNYSFSIIDILGTSVLFTVLTAIFYGVYSKIDVLYERIIYRKSINPRDVQVQISQELVTTLDIEEIAEKLKEYISKMFDPKYFSFITIDDQGIRHVILTVGIDSVSLKESLEHHLDSLDSDTSPMIYRLENRMLVVPLISSSRNNHERLGLMIVGPRKDDRGYSSEDLNVLITIGSQAGRALKTSSLSGELSKTQLRYRSLVLTSTDGILECDLNGVITFTNPELLRLLRYPEGTSIVGQSVFDFVAQEDRKSAISYFLPERIADQSFSHQEARLKRSDDTIFPAEIAASTIKDEDNNVISYVIIIHDITSRKRYEYELRYERDRAMLYLDILGHDIRNQLQVVEVASEIAEMLELNPDFDSTLKSLQEATSRITRIIEKVEATEQLIVRPLRRIDLVSVISVTIREFETMYSDVILEGSIETDNAVIMGDEHLNILLMNLLENAAEHNTGSEKRVWIKVQETTDEYLFKVEDNGPGIPDSRKSDLFDMTRRYGGVSLHQCREIVTKYEGRIEIHDRVEGQPQLGASFYVWFPKADRTITESESYTTQDMVES